MEELQKQLTEMAGTNSALKADGTSSAGAKQLYPPIRQLPLLGVEWADLYRQLKVQEAVFELLTKQYEMARMEEARDTPVVNVVDPANLAERKSSPQRLLLILASTTLSLLISAACVIGAKRWRQVDLDDPLKLLVRSVLKSVSTQREKIVVWMTVKGFGRRWFNPSANDKH
jgi:uncharacterized protein involved in exopolysaccharide biosynthesis